jgi:hypothetical protein
MDMQRYWEVVQEKICPRCLDGDGQGNCRLPAGEDCALKSFLPQIVMTVANTHADSIDAYVNALRRNICILCDHQRADMSCAKRNDLECSLDRYFPLVVQIIETVREEMQKGAPHASA